MAGTSTRAGSRWRRALLRWALYQAALGAARTAAGRARLLANRQGDRHTFVQTNVELVAKLLSRVWGVWRSGRPYTLPVAAPVTRA